MSIPDLNQLVTLEALLSEGSVAGAARRLRLSPSAMSRALARLRESMGDPLLVRAGRDLVPTPRALELREQVQRLVRESEAVLRPAGPLVLPDLERTFTLRTREGFVENVGPSLLARLAREAPGVRLRFVQKSDKESTALREGLVDLETGVVGRETGPEVRLQALFRDRFVGVVRPGHRLAEVEVTAARYAAARHVHVSRRGLEKGPVDEALAARNLSRHVAATVDTFSAALALARTTDVVATVPERQTGCLRDGLVTFGLPVDGPELTVALMWHPRHDGDAAHRWLRAVLRDAATAVGWALGPAA